MVNRNAALVSKQQDRILKSAKECFLKSGLAHTTMREIATQADMSLGNVYRYFTNKEVLIREFIAIDNREMNNAFALLDNSKQFKRILVEIAKELIKSLSTKSELLIYVDFLSEALRDEGIMELLAIEESELALTCSLEKAVKEKRIKLTMPADTAALGIMAFIENAALKCIVNKKYSVRAANKQFGQYLDAIIE